MRPALLLLHLAGVLAVVAAVLLGQWQIGAWQEHRRDQAAELADVPPRPLQDVIGPDDPFPSDGVGRPVLLAGSWLPQSTVYVADRLHDRTQGLWMVTPLSTCGSSGTRCTDPSALPVVLGWTPSVDQAPPPPQGDASLTGWLQPGDASGGPDPDPADDVLPSLRIAELLQRVDQDLYGGYVILDTPAAVRTTLTAVTPDSLPDPPTFTAVRNLLYGIEWWCFGLFAVFLWWRWVRDEVQRAQHPGAEDQSAPPQSPRIPSEP